MARGLHHVFDNCNDPSTLLNAPLFVSFVFDYIASFPLVPESSAFSSDLVVVIPLHLVQPLAKVSLFVLFALICLFLGPSTILFLFLSLPLSLCSCFHQH